MLEQRTTLSAPTIEELGSAIIGAALAVHRVLGMGLRQKIYTDCLAYELEQRGNQVHRDAEEIVIYKDQVFESGVVLDLLVEDQIAVVCISADAIDETHVLALLNQISLSNIKLGLIINFNTKYLRGPAIKRVANGRW
jgi:GxxExxY protein